jgi:hypothetical protein
MPYALLNKIENHFLSSSPSWPVNVFSIRHYQLMVPAVFTEVAGFQIVEDHVVDERGGLTKP